MTVKTSVLLASALAVVAAASCRSTDDAAVAERRAYAQLTKETTLVALEKDVPNARARIDSAAGWAAFSDGGAAALGMKDGVGFGVAHDNRTKAETYLRMKRPEDAGAACRLLLVFADAKAFAQFVATGGKFDGPPPAGVDVFQFFGDELAPEPQVAGTSFSRDAALNAR